LRARDRLPPPPPPTRARRRRRLSRAPTGEESSRRS
jgi:hypothetical protein